MNPQARDIVAQLQKAGHAAYFAGGSVRDQLLGVEAKDYDIATDARPEEVQKIFPRVTDVTGKSFGVVRVMVGQDSYEVATFREDGQYKDGRHPESVRFATAEEDAQRRDFTVNGLFYDPVAEKLTRLCRRRGGPSRGGLFAPLAIRRTVLRKTICGCCARFALRRGFILRSRRRPGNRSANRRRISVRSAPSASGMS